MATISASESKSGDVVFGNKSTNSIWPFVIVGVVVLFAVAWFKKKKN